MIGHNTSYKIIFLLHQISRLGGGYGGKEVQSKFVAAAAAFCAQQLKQPVRVANYHVQDMHMIGKRHAFTGHLIITLQLLRRER